MVWDLLTPEFLDYFEALVFCISAAPAASCVPNPEVSKCRGSGGLSRPGRVICDIHGLASIGDDISLCN